MKKLLPIFILCIFSTAVTAQSLLQFKNGSKHYVYPYFRTNDVLYFSKTLGADTAYMVPLSQLSDIPSSVTEIKSVKPEVYINKFRKGQLSGIWLAVLGTLATSIGAASTKDKVSPLVYVGVGASVIGFGITLSSFGNLKKYYIMKSAELFTP